jgi:hypothetical protein
VQDLTKIDDMLKKQGATWGARADVINHASWAISQVVDAVAENCWTTGALLIQTSFDEFNIDVRISYEGELLEFPQQRPTEDEILESDDGRAPPGRLHAAPHRGQVALGNEGRQGAAGLSTSITRMAPRRGLLRGRTKCSSMRVLYTKQSTPGGLYEVEVHAHGIRVGGCCALGTLGVVVWPKRFRKQRRHPQKSALR